MAILLLVLSFLCRLHYVAPVAVMHSCGVWRLEPRGAMASEYRVVVQGGFLIEYPWDLLPGRVFCLTLRI